MLVSIEMPFFYCGNRCTAAKMAHNYLKLFMSMPRNCCPLAYKTMAGSMETISADLVLFIEFVWYCIHICLREALSGEMLYQILQP